MIINWSGTCNLVIVMTKLEIKGNWNILKGKLKERWGELTDDDLDRADGDLDQLIGRLQIISGKTKEELHDEVDRLFAD